MTDFSFEGSVLQLQSDVFGMKKIIGPLTINYSHRPQQKSRIRIKSFLFHVVYNSTELITTVLNIKLLFFIAQTSCQCILFHCLNS